MEAAERDALARRRRWFRADIAHEQMVAGELTNAELGRYYRARIAAEAAGRITPEAERIAGKGKARELLQECAEGIEADMCTYVSRCAGGQKGAAKRWVT